MDKQAITIQFINNGQVEEKGIYACYYPEKKAYCVNLSQLQELDTNAINLEHEHVKEDGNKITRVCYKSKVFNEDDFEIEITEPDKKHKLNVRKHAHVSIKRKPIGDELTQTVLYCTKVYNNDETVSQLKDEVHSILKPLLDDETSVLYKLIKHNELPGEEYEDKYQIIQQEAREACKLVKAKGNVPNMLLHGLNNPKLFNREQKIDQIRAQFVRSTIGLLLGPSGCGKTRTVLESLSENFGIYLTASTASSGGSNDMSLILKSDQTEPSVSDSIRLVFRFESIVATRLIFLRILQELASERSLVLTPFHWMMIQQSIVEIFQIDIFEYLLRYSVSLSALNETQDMQSPFLIVIDEAQILIAIKTFCGNSLLRDIFKKAAYSSGDCGLHYSATIPIMYSFSRMHQKLPQLRLMLAGTRFQYQDLITDCENSSILKDLVLDFFFISLGNFLAFEPFRAYVRWYIRPDKLTDQDMVRLHKVLRGRYRFTAAFIADFCAEPRIDKIIKVLKESTVVEVQNSLISLHRHYASQYPDYFPVNCVPETIIGDYLNCNDLLQLLLYNYLCTFQAINCSVDLHIKRALYIQAGLGIVEQDELVQFNSYQYVISQVRIGEPLIAAILNRYAHDLYLKKSP